MTLNNPYRTEVEPIWCPGCGNYGTLQCLTAKVFTELGIPNNQISIVSGIGCASRIPGYIETYGFNIIHGRAIPFAIGQKIGAEIKGIKLLVVVIGGDGDLSSIGGNHFIHAARNLTAIKVIMVDNHNFAMTKGQAGPTTPFSGDVIKAEVLNPQLDPLRIMLDNMISAGSGFLAQGLATNINHLSRIMKEAILYNGFAFVNVQTPCPTFNTASWLDKLKDKNFCFYLEEGKPVELPNGETWIHDPTNADLAWRLLKVPIDQRPYLGVIWRGPELKENYLERIRRIYND